MRILDNFQTIQLAERRHAEWHPQTMPVAYETQPHVTDITCRIEHKYAFEYRFGATFMGNASTDSDLQMKEIVRWHVYGEFMNDLSELRHQLMLGANRDDILHMIANLERKIMGER